MNLKQILKEEIESVGFPIIQRSFFENINIEKGDFKNNDSSEKILYRGDRTNSIKSHDGMFFSEDYKYAELIGGPQVSIAEVKINKPLYLSKYNDIFRTKNLIGSNNQGFLTLHRDNIKNWWAYYLDSIWNEGFKNELYEFENELKTCDSIFGEDTGHPGSKVWYIKYASQIEFINLSLKEDFKPLPPNTEFKYESYGSGAVDQYIYVNNKYVGGVIYRSNGVISLAKIEDDEYRGLNLYPNALFSYVRKYKKPAISIYNERNKNSQKVWDNIKNNLPTDMKLIYEKGDYILSLK